MRGQHQDRHAVAEQAQPAAHLEPVDVGHADVEHDGVGHAFDHRLERRDSTLGGLHLVVGERQRAPQGLAHRTVVIDYEDPHPAIVAHAAALPRALLRCSYIRDRGAGTRVAAPRRHMVRTQSRRCSPRRAGIWCGLSHGAARRSACELSPGERRARPCRWRRAPRSRAAPRARPRAGSARRRSAR